MSGHSKWATIKHKKGAADAARAKQFAKLLRVVEVAAREGGSDVTMNATPKMPEQIVAIDTWMMSHIDCSAGGSDSGSA